MPRDGHPVDESPPEVKRSRCVSRGDGFSSPQPLNRCRVPSSSTLVPCDSLCLVQLIHVLSLDGWWNVLGSDP